MTTNEDVTAYNSMCAQFLGWRKSGMKGLELWYEKDNRMGEQAIDLKFHSDWNRIMEVVEAINKTQNQRGVADTTHSTLKRDVQALLGSANKKEATQAINQFLIWYGNEKERIH